MVQPGVSWFLLVQVFIAAVGASDEAAVHETDGNQPFGGISLAINIIMFWQWLVIPHRLFNGTKNIKFSTAYLVRWMTQVKKNFVAPPEVPRLLYIIL